MMLVPIRDIAESIAYELQDNGQHNVQRYIKFGINCIKELNFDTSRKVLTVEIPMQENKTIELPANCVSVNKVGIRLGDNVYCLTENRHIPKPYCRPEDAPEVTLPQMPSGYDVAFTNFCYGGQYGTLYGVRKGLTVTGTYREFFNDGIIAFDSDVPTTTVYIEYISDGINHSGSTCVHPFAVETIKAYVKWKVKADRRDINLGEKEYLKQEYFTEHRRLKSRMQKFTVADVLQVSRDAYGLTVNT